MSAFLSAPPRIRLLQAFARPFSTAVAAARSCYTAKGIVEAGDSDAETRERIGRSVFEAGHHTTFQHGQLMFSLEGVSRQFLWSFLHAHPFYNSEQVSQRYTRVRKGSFVVPALADAASQEIYERQLERSMAHYEALSEALYAPCARQYFRVFGKRADHAERWKPAIRKRAYEIARYVLPVATTAHLYHTVSLLTLLRYHRLIESYDVPEETRVVVTAMVGLARELDPEIDLVVQDPLPLEATPEAEFLAARPAPASAAFRSEFDRELAGLRSRLVSRKPDNVRLVADAVREVMGRPRADLDDRAAVALALDPAQNRLLGEPLNLTTHSKLSRALHHAHYTFRRKLSHTADSQDQRHRMTPASRPVLSTHVDGEPDYEVPELLGPGHLEGAEQAIRERYDQAMAEAWEAMAELRRRGVPGETALYLLPNAASLRYTESSDLLNLRHKHLMRLCYNAQEEIWRASVEEARQIREAEPEIGEWLLPPCTARMRARAKPWCPEGDRYCGVMVWRKDLEEYERVI